MIRRLGREHGHLTRATALVLSWAMTATSVWAVAPPLGLQRGETRKARGAGTPSADSDVAAPPTGVAASAASAPDAVAVPSAARDTGRPVQLGSGATADTSRVTSGTAQPVTVGSVGALGTARPRGATNLSIATLRDARGDASTDRAEAPKGVLGRTVELRSGLLQCSNAVRAPEVWAPPPTGAAPACEVTFFGPRRYDRTSGPPNVYTTVLSVPSWTASPYAIHIRNGEPDGSHRVSSATITANGNTIAVPSDFNQNVAGIERAVTLQPTSAIEVRISSPPGSYLTIDLCGQKGDHRAPDVTWTKPAPGSATRDTTPRLEVRYQDVFGGSPDTGTSAVDPSTLRIFVDDVERTSLFTRRSDSASVEWPNSLAFAAGVHLLRAEVKDLAGNLGSGSAEFTVDLTRPQIQLEGPANGALLNTTTPTLRVSYSDDIALDLQSLEVEIDEVDRTSWFTVGAAEAVATGHTLTNGPHRIEAEIKDRAGNEREVEGWFRIDTVAPTLTVVRPVVDAALPTAQVALDVRYSDDHQLNLASFAADVDGAPLTLTVGATAATGTTPALAEGAHALHTAITDAAGNTTTVTTSFSVDLTAPLIDVELPPDGTYVTTAEPSLRITYSDAQGINTSTLSVLVRGVERRTLLTAAKTFAEGDLTGAAALSDGNVDVVASIGDGAGHTASDTSHFTVDTVAPAVSVTAPVSGAYVNVAQPSLAVTYSDATSDVDLAQVRLTVDGVDETSWFAAGAAGAAGTPPTALAEGAHTLQGEVKDHAGLTSSASSSFFIDTVPPQVAVALPADNAFTNDATPLLSVTYSDPGGAQASGLDQAKTTATLLDPDGIVHDVKAYLTWAAGQAQGELPAEQALADGTYVLRVEVEDLAGNRVAAQSTFVVDTLLPELCLEAPAPGGFSGTATPSLLVRYRDERSGVDLQRLRLVIDAADVTARLQLGEEQATGVLLPVDALADGLHQVQLVVYDRAGNEATAGHGFTVDTVSPTAGVELPAPGSWHDVSPTLVRVTYADTVVPDAGNGIDPLSLIVTIDGVDRTADSTVGATQAEASFTTPFGEGEHVVRVDVLDWAAHPAFAEGRFTVDTQAPVLTLVSPAEGSYHAAAAVSVTGTIADLDPQVSVSASVGTAPAVQCSVDALPAGAATLTPRAFTCAVTLSEGENTVTVNASDRLAHTTSVTRTLHLDSAAPQVFIVEPSEGQWVSGTTLDVSGGVVDATPVTLEVEGVAATVTGASWSATGVLLGAGPDITLHATATDAAGNTGSATVTVHVDREAPAVAITSPAAGAYVQGPTLSVQGTVSDNAPQAVLVDVNGQQANVSAGAFEAALSVVDGPLTLQATARDAAGNVGTAAAVNVTVDSAAPAITISAPASGLITNATGVHITGTVTDATPLVRVSVAGVAVTADAAGAFETDVALNSTDGPQSITVEAEDSAHNIGTATASVIVDRTPPDLTVVEPQAGAVLGSPSVLVQGTVTDAHAGVTVTVDGAAATLNGNAWQATVTGLAEPAHTFQITATDTAGNISTRSVAVTVDLGPPLVTITSPADGSATNQTAVTVTGTAQDATLQSVSVNGVAATLTPAGVGQYEFTATGVALAAEGDNLVRAVALDGAQRQSETQITVTRDTTPPLVELQAPESITRTRPGHVTVTASDVTSAVSTVVVKVNGAVASSFTAPPYELELTVPADAQPGDTLTLVAEATDAAGNVGTATRGVRVAGDGVIVGQVLDDITSLPLAGATVTLLSDAQAASATTDETGRYTLPGTGTVALLRATKAGMTLAERDVAVASAVGTVPVDARLTALAAPVVIDGAGGTLSVTKPATTAGASPLVLIEVAVPAGAVIQATDFRLTPLSPHGVPGLLPLGYSALQAFDVQAGGELFAPLTATAHKLPASVTSALLVRYDLTQHAWVLVGSSLAPANGSVDTALPAPGTYALVVPDDGVVVPASGALQGVPMQELPATITASGGLTPSAVAPTGQTSQGRLRLNSPTPLPSGTVVQAKVTERYSLANGQVASEEQRLIDIVLQHAPSVSELLSVGDVNAGATLRTTFPVRPARTWDVTELLSGKVTLDILSGREGVRGATGGSEPVTVDSGDARVIVPRGALPRDTVVALTSETLSAWLPSEGGVQAVAEMVVDFSGATLTLGAELSVACATCTAGETYVLARVERWNGVPYVAVVALASYQPGAQAGDVGRVVSVPYAGLPGVTAGGRYVFFRVPSAVGFVAGTATHSSGPRQALVQTPGGLPFAGLSRSDGSYIVAALPAASVTVKATVPPTPLAGEGSVEVLAAQTAALNITLVGAATTVSVRPENGAVGVPVGTSIELTAGAPLDPATVNASTLVLHKGDPAANVTVTLRYVLSGSRRTLTLIPQAPEGSEPGTPALEPDTSYTLVVTGLRDAYGGDVAVPATTFRTKDNTPPVYDTTALTFSFPDADGLVHVSAPAGALPPASEILIINTTSGVVVTLTATTAGVQGEIPASINDRLVVTITDPDGNVTTFETSEYVDPSTGQTAIGPGGGRVRGPAGSGIELRVPEGAATRGVTLKITAVNSSDPAAATLPDLPQTHFGSGIRIESADKPAFEKEVDLVFSVPSFDALPVDQRPAQPQDAFYYVVRRIVGDCVDPNADPQTCERNVIFQTLDHAFVEGAGADTRVVTASPPFAGYFDSTASFSVTPTAGLLIQPSATAYAFLLWSYDALLPGRALPGVVTGTVRRVRWNPGAALPQYEPVPKGTLVAAVDQGGTPLLGNRGSVALTDAQGRFTLWDATYTGGPVTIAAALEGSDPTQPCPTTPTVADRVRCTTAFEANPSDWSTTNLRFYPNIATAEITFPAEQPPPPPPAVQVEVFKSLPDGSREATNGVVVAGTPLIIGFKLTGNADGAVMNAATVQGQTRAVQGPLTNDPAGLTYVLDSEYAPAQPGTVTVTGTVQPPFGAPTTQTATFLVIAEGGGTVNLPGQPPAVITARLVPRANATGVAVDVRPQVAFTEPVKRVASNVRLEDVATSTPVALTISGTATDGTPIASVTDANEVTSVTLTPLAGLRFKTRYRLVIDTGIEDGDTPPKNLVSCARDANGNALPGPCTLTFETFGPEEVPSSGGNVASPGIVVMGERAYLAQIHVAGVQGGVIRGYNVEDPVEPQELPGSLNPPPPSITRFNGRPVDIHGQEETGLSDGRMLVAGSGVTARSVPSNLHLYDVTNDNQFRWLGSASVASSANEGSLWRFVIKDGHAYTVTHKRGIQVVDLGVIKQRWDDLGGAEAGQSNPAYWQAVQSLNTDGRGFARDAVVDTIAVTYELNGQPRAETLLDLKVGDIGAAGRVVVATGAQSSLVTAAPHGTPATVLWKGKLENAGSMLEAGQALDIGVVGSQNLAVVAGTGQLADPQTGQPGPTTTLLAVADLADPSTPTTLALLDLTSTTGFAVIDDVVLREGQAFVSGRPALVGGPASVAVISLQDPTHPTYAGTITGVGGRLAFAGSLLFSTARSNFGGVDPLNGLHVATLQTIGAIQRPKPTFSRLVADASAPQEEIVTDIPVRLQVIPANPEVQQAKLTVYTNAAVALQTTVPIESGSSGVFKLLKGFRRAVDAATTAVMEFFTGDGTRVQSPPREIDIGQMFVRVDSNNDTVVEAWGSPADQLDEAADLAARNDASKEGFVFWEGDAEAEPVAALVDYATVSVRHHLPIDPAARIALRLEHSRWELHRKVRLQDVRSPATGTDSRCLAQNKLYLCDDNAARLQALWNDGVEPNPPQPRQDGVIEIPMGLLSEAQTDFIFRCTSAAGGLSTCPSTVLDVGWIAPDGSYNVLAKTKLRIKPLAQLLTMETARRDDNVSFPSGNPPTVLDGVGSHHRVGPTMRPLPGWPMPVPPTAEEITVLVHGFNVDQRTATSSFVPTLFKRLYWTGHPVIGVQNNSHTVGIVWPGDIPDNILWGIATTPYFPEDEFSALQVGVPLGKRLAELRPGRRRLNILAHSLGNMVVNSALQQMDGNASGAPITYLMWDAAVPAEAFSTTYVPTAIDNRSQELLQHLSTLSYPDDSKYQDEWREISRQAVVCEGPPSAPPPDCDAYNRWKADAAYVSAAIQPPPDYAVRWRQAAGAGWKGFFAGNVRPDVDIWNAFSNTDHVLRTDQGTGSIFQWWRIHAWLSCQYQLKPYAEIALPDEANDHIFSQFWTLLLGTSSQRAVTELDRLWADGASHASTTRRWAELAFWFPATSAPAGNQAVAALTHNVSMADVGGEEGPPALGDTGTPSHSYLWIKRLPEVWRGYLRVRDAFGAGR